ncbi:MAG: L-threonine 3-dehydrogenase [Lachnospiraceae bacterium]|nr:L-threonine 3-dehydrogenase [Lachnospiraceae bacterium]
METMRAVVKTKPGPGNIELRQVPIPKIGSTDILVKIKACAVCGTDVHVKNWDPWAEKRMTPPSIMGHEFAGEVIEVGENVTTIKVGDIVSAETHVVCNTCEMCHYGHRHVCYNTKTIGVSRDGSFADYIAIPAENAYVCDPSIPVEVLSLLEPFGAGVHAVMEFPLALKTVAVIGCGPIGVMSIAAAKAVGASRVIAIEPNEKRAKLALELGADELVDPMKCDVIKTIKDMTGGRGVDVVLEYSGNVGAMKAAMSYLKPEGKMAALGLPSKELSFDISEFVYRGLTLKGIAGRLMYDTWEQCGALLKKGVDISKVVTHVLPLEDFEEGLRLMETGECCKAVFKIND